MTRFSKTPAGNNHDTLLSVEWYPKSIRAESWREAMDQVAALGEGWRAPTIDELSSLCDRTRREPACDPVLEMPFDDWHWSSSAVVGWPEYTWAVHFYGGGVLDGGRDGGGFVRPVREAKS